MDATVTRPLQVGLFLPTWTPGEGLPAWTSAPYPDGPRWGDVLEQIKHEFATGPAADFHPFLSQGTRGFVQERRMPPGATLKLRRASDDGHEERRFRARAG